MKTIAKTGLALILAATLSGCTASDLTSGLDTAGPRLYSSNRAAEKGYINSRAINDTAGRPAMATMTITKPA